MTAWKIAAVALGLGLVGLAGAADDKKKGDDKKPADWSAFVTVSQTVKGEVVKAEENEFTLRVPKGRKAEELTFQFAEHGLVRWKALPTRLDDNGKKKPFSSEEVREMKQPPGAPGYAAERTDLKPKYLVEVTLVRPKEIPANKAAFQDLKVKYVVILAGDPNAKKPEEKKKEKP